MPFFYILYSPSLDSYYIGHTAGSVSDRLEKHLSKHQGYTSKAKDWQVVYTEVYSDKLLAYAREREVKSWKSKIRLQALMELDSADSEHPA